MKKQSITALLNCHIICGDDIKLVDIFVKDNVIFSMGGNLKADNIIDMQGAFLLPKFFNIHSHLGENLFPSPDSDCTIKKYLQYTSKITDNLSAEENQKLWSKSAELAISEMNKYGTIGFCAARSTELASMNNLITMSGYPFMISKKLHHYSNDSFNKYKNYYTQNVSEMCSVGIFLHSLYTVNESILSQVKKCYDYMADFITAHVSEDEETREQEIMNFGIEPIAVLDKWGLLTNKTIVVHGGYLSQEELSLIKKRNASIAVCPISNTVLNTVCADIIKLKELGINWCIASDGMTTGKTFSLIEQANHLRRNYAELSSVELFNAITRNPAQLFNKQTYTGAISTNTIASFLTRNARFDSIENVLNDLFENAVKWEGFEVS